jgi:hypothetical protein
LRNLSSNDLVANPCTCANGNMEHQRSKLSLRAPEKQNRYANQKAPSKIVPEHE